MSAILEDKRSVLKTFNFGYTEERSCVKHERDADNFTTYNIKRIIRTMVLKKKYNLEKVFLYYTMSRLIFILLLDLCTVWLWAVLLTF